VVGRLAGEANAPGKREMGNISFEDLPPEIRARIREESALVGKQRQRVTAWKDVPASWKQCRPHGFAWMGDAEQCPRCEYPDGDEGDSNVEAP